MRKFRRLKFEGSWFKKQNLSSTLNCLVFIGLQKIRCLLGDFAVKLNDILFLRPDCCAIAEIDNEPHLFILEAKFSRKAEDAKEKSTEARLQIDDGYVPAMEAYFSAQGYTVKPENVFSVGMSLCGTAAKYEIDVMH